MKQDGAIATDTTFELLERARAGDGVARDKVIERCLPALRRWAHGRVPPLVRDLHDTADLVQDTVLSALKRLDTFEARREGALQAYLRQALVNRVRDVVRMKLRRPPSAELPANLVDPSASPLDHAIGRDNVERYERALRCLRPEDREAIVARVELQYDYDQLAAVLGKPSPNAARVAVARALQRLARAMQDLDR